MILAEAELAGLAERAFFVQDDLLGGAAALALHRELDTLARAGRLRPAGVSRGGSHRRDPETRGDAIAWLLPGAAPPGLGGLWARFEALQEALNRDAWLGLARFEVQLARYPGAGTRYRRHRDAFPGRANRRVTAIYYANPGWRPADGGLLRVHLAAGPVDIEPILDRLVVFLSERLEHEVLPVWAPRLAVTAWFRGHDALPV